MPATLTPPKAILEKRGLYLDAGANEVWECGQGGEMRFITRAGS